MKPSILLLPCALLVGCQTTAHHDAQATATSVRQIPLKHVDAAATADTLTQQLKSGEDFRIVADVRSNSLLLAGTSADIKRAEAAVASIDQPTAAP
jgi:hypothetical protein